MSDQHTACKLWCLDQIMRDQRATHLDFRLAYYIASVTDRATGKARFKQSTAAEALGVTRRGIQIAAERLKSLGHIDIGFTPGKGHLNTYRLHLEKANFRSHIVDKMANTDAHYTGQRANTGSPFATRKGEQREQKRRTESRGKAIGHSHSSLDSIPCLIPTRACEPAIADALGSLGASLSARIGADKAHSWFGKATVVDVTGDTLTLEVPTRFIASRILQDYEAEIVACSSALLPSITTVRVTVADQGYRTAAAVFT
jgi:hypothetical protein